MSKTAKLRVCASCEYVFKVEDLKHAECPMCGFGMSFGARYVYGNKAYRYQKTQECWMKKKINSYEHYLMEKVKIMNENKDCINKWKCKCGWCGDEPVIHAGVYGSNIVDILDIFCPNCPASEGDGLIFVGSDEKRDEWLEDWFGKQENK